MPATIFISSEATTVQMVIAYRNLNDREPFLRVFLIPDAVDIAGTSQEKSKYNYIIILILLIIYNNIHRYQYEIHYAYLLIFSEKLPEIQ